ncbi:MAG: hypothetical protein ACIAQZ_01595 [Sedimentisphaeraceae bacterium JB056]
MSYIYGCPQCKTSIETSASRTLRCSNCGKIMNEIARENWLHKCNSCEFENENPTPGVYDCPMCDGKLCPSRPV